MERICIIGGGAAGCMAAATILEKTESTDFEIVLIEKNAALGKKVRISGGGRCNVTTGISDKTTVLEKYVRGSTFLKYGIGKFGPKKTYEWFESNGLALKNENDNRVFPVSDTSDDVMNIFETLFQNRHVKILYNTAVEAISDCGGSGFEVRTAHESIMSDWLIITTGGNAYRHTGSTGDGYQFGEKFGHSITQLGPSLSSLVITENWVKELSGVVLDKAQFRIGDLVTPVQTSGSVLFTHFGISGPGTFALSSHIAYESISPTSPLGIRILPLASWDTIAWDTYLQDVCAKNGTRDLKNCIKELLPMRFIEKTFHSHGLHELLSKKCSQISKKDRVSIAQLYGHGLLCTCIQRRPGDEFVTAGGISTEEIQKETMESKIHKKLFFAGEILNIDGLTGGFNLQCAWTTGRLAGEEIAKRLQK